MAAEASVPLTLTLSGGNTMKNLLMRLWHEQEGQDLTEYALLVVLLALAAIVGMKGLAGSINNVFSSAASNLTANT
jgi:pilus assembly protein Flp/PilA